MGSPLSNSAAALKVAVHTLSAGAWGGRMDLIHKEFLFGLSRGSLEGISLSLLTRSLPSTKPLSKGHGLKHLEATK